MELTTKRRLAKLVWPRYSAYVDIINRNSQLIDSLREYDRKSVRKCAHRFEMYRGINELLGDVAISYLEFGVYEGESLKKWTEINTNAGSRFYGFDSFEGLPEIWNRGGFGDTVEKGKFDRGGLPPIVGDPRVKLIKGWFQHTLRDFLRETKLSHPIIVHVDCDLHSSALYVLCTLDHLLERGDIVIFDEFTSPTNEYLAWEEYKRAFMRSAECISTSSYWIQTAFRIN